MKKIMIPLILCILLISFSTAAQIYFPLPINGKILGPNIQNLEIQVTNLRTNKVMTTLTTEAGEYLIDWANSDDDSGSLVKYQNGDSFEIEVTSCTNNIIACKQTMVYDGSQSELYTEFDLSSVLVTCPVIRCSRRRCSEPDPVDTCPELVCPEENEDTTPYESCDSCCVTQQPLPPPEDCIDPDNCPPGDGEVKPQNNLIPGIIGLIIGLIFGAGIMFKILGGK